jgi:putative two-component system protein, hydrogenase maturation factor HypX/HoxX
VLRRQPAFDEWQCDDHGAIADAGRRLADDPGFGRRLLEKHRRREAEEAAKPLERYRAEELEGMRLNFYGFDPSYHVARYNFIHKVPKSRTPPTLAQHRINASPPGLRESSRA